MTTPRKHNKPPKPIKGWVVKDPPKAPAEPSPDEAGLEEGFKTTARPRREVRLQKVLAAAGMGSRRACEELIENGEVTVNGHLYRKLPVMVDPFRDHIVANGKKIKSAEPFLYIMLFKPRGVVCTNSDPQGRKRAIDLVKHPSRPRLYTVGRLDEESSGLLLLTNDGEFANRITHPRYGVHKVYEVTVAGALSEKEVERLQRGLYLTGRREQGRSRGKGKGRARIPQKDKQATRTRDSKLEVVKRDRDRTRLRLELREGRNRQIRRMMALLGHPVKKLRRIQLGPLKLRDLKPGQWRELMPQELGALQRAAHRDDEKKKVAGSR